METLGQLLFHSITGSNVERSNISPGRSGGGNTVSQTIPTIPEVKHRNVLFLLDENGSVGATNFEIEKNLTIAFVNGAVYG